MPPMLHFPDVFAGSAAPACDVEVGEGARTKQRLQPDPARAEVEGREKQPLVLSAEQGRLDAPAP